MEGFLLLFIHMVLALNDKWEGEKIEKLILSSGRFLLNRVRLGKEGEVKISEGVQADSISLQLYLFTMETLNRAQALRTKTVSYRVCFTLQLVGGIKEISQKPVQNKPLLSVIWLFKAGTIEQNNMYENPYHRLTIDAEPC